MNHSILSFDPHQLLLGFEFWLIHGLCTDSSKILLEVSEQSMHSSVGHYHNSTQVCTSSCTTYTMVKHTSSSSCIICTMTNTNQCGDKSARVLSASYNQKKCTPPCLQVGIPPQAYPTKSIHVNLRFCGDSYLFSKSVTRLV
jgi:hypothetical protein